MNLSLFVFRVVVYTLLSLAILLAVKVYDFLCPSHNEALLNQSLFHPVKVIEYDKSMYNIAGVEGKDVEFCSSGNGNVLHGIFYPQNEAKYVALINHGNGGNILACRPNVEALLQSNVSVFTYDYRGYGASKGSPTVKGVVDDAIAAYDLINTKLKTSGQKIILYGASLGSGVTTELAKLKPASGIIFDSPFLSPEILAKEKLPYFNVYPSNLWFKPALDNAEYVVKKHPPLLIVSAENDIVIPSSHSKRLFDLAMGPKTIKVFKNSNHCWFKNDFEDYKSTIGRFVKSLGSEDKGLDRLPG